MFQIKSPVKYYFNGGLVVLEALLVLIRAGDSSRRAGEQVVLDLQRWDSGLEL